MKILSKTLERSAEIYQDAKRLKLSIDSRIDIFQQGPVEISVIKVFY